MSLDSIPVRVLGPGSQPEGDQALSYISMPSDMATYRPPQLGDIDSVAALPGARDAIDWLRGALADYQPGGATVVADLSGLDADSRALINQVLGEGEVSITLASKPSAKTQESVLAGVWRTLYFDEKEHQIADLVEVGHLPHTVRAPVGNGDGNGQPVDRSESPEHSMGNALPILTELETAAARFAAEGTSHSINLSLLPLSEAELEFLDERLGRGPVDILSRAYGKCRIISTRTPNVWWVRYYNSMSTLILNSLEVVDVPEVVRAAPEDLHDSADRLERILAPYSDLV